MTIKKAEPWEQPYDGTRFVDVASESELADCAYERYQKEEILYARLLKGNLRKDLGLSIKQTRAEVTQEIASAPVQQFSVDLGIAVVAEKKYPFVSHFVARTFLGSGKFFIAMNSGWKGSLYLGPKAHPNDGLLDVTCGSLRFRDRIQALEKAKSGLHLSHPELRYKRSRSWEEHFDRPVKMYRDDQYLGKYRSLKIELYSDVLFLVV